MPTASAEKPDSPAAFFRKQCPSCTYWVDYAPDEIKSVEAEAHPSNPGTLNIRRVTCPNCHAPIEISRTTRRTA